MALFLESWISIAASCITIGLALPYGYRFITSIIDSIFHKEVFSGTWYTYHYTRDSKDETIFKEMEFKFKRNLQNKVIIKAKEQASRSEYKGTVSKEEDYHLFLLRKVKSNQKESAQMRFYDYIPHNEEDKVFGLWMGIDHGKKPIAGMWLMSKKPLSEAEAKKLIQDKTIINDRLMLSIRK